MAEPFRVGSLVQWTLGFSEKLDCFPGPAIICWEAHGERLARGSVILTGGNVRAWPYRQLGEGPHDLRGAFFEDHHELAGDEVLTTGRVRRIRFSHSSGQSV